MFNFLSYSNPFDTKVSKKKEIAKYLLLAAIAVFGIFLFTNQALATAAQAGQMIDGVIKVVSLIVIIVGVLFCIVGIVKFAIAHAENQGAEQQKAALMLATGIALVVLSIIIKNVVPWNTIVQQAATNAQSGGN